MIWVNTFFTCGRSKLLSSEAWNLLANIQWDSFMSSIRSTSRILSMSLYSQTKHFFLQTPESQEKYFISEIFQLQPYSSPSLSLWLSHNAMKYWKWHSLCVWCRLGTCLQNQSYFLPHDWSIALHSGFSCWLWNSWMFYEVSVTLLISSYIFHTNRRDCISIVWLMIYDHTSCQIL